MSKELEKIEELSVKLYSCRAQKKTFSNKYKRTKLHYEAFKQAVETVVAQDISNKIDDLTSDIYMGYVIKKSCNICNRYNTFAHIDEECSNCRGNGYIFERVEK